MTNTKARPRIKIRAATPGDIDGMVTIDRAAFDQQDARYTASELASLIAADDASINVATDNASGDILGYSVVLAARRSVGLYPGRPTRRYAAEAIPPVDPEAYLIDYTLDHIALKDPSQVTVGALLIKRITLGLEAGRRARAITISDDGEHLMTNMGFRRGASTIGDGIQHTEFTTCAYEARGGVFLVNFVPKEPLPMTVICRGCDWYWCSEWGRHVEGGRGRWRATYWRVRRWLDRLRPGAGRGRRHAGGGSGAG